MNRYAVYHREKSEYSYPLDQNTVVIRLRTAKNDVEQVELFYGDRFCRNKRTKTQRISMELQSTDGYFDYYEVILSTKLRRICYYFRLNDGEELLYFFPHGFQQTVPEERNKLFQIPYICQGDLFVTPEWAKGTVFYQIFPDRFNNGDPSNDPQSTASWDSTPKGSLDQFGGDLQGIIDKLDYLKELGIGGIYLTPIFLANTNHKYDTIDYFEIDPQFGSKEKLSELVEKAHERGIKIILDAVLNHSSDQFFAFQDVKQNGENSRYRDWYEIHNFPVDPSIPNYECFAYVGSMPKLMTQNKEVRDYLIRVGTYWIEECNIDGWRLDVANEVDHAFWREFRNAVKEIKPKALIVGEAWNDSSAWLQGDQWDSVMNYIFTRAVIEFMAADTITAEEFSNTMGKLESMYQKQAQEVLFNLLDSHDVPRFLHETGEDVDKLKLASMFQFTYKGAPMIYYGTEVGMTGGDDPLCRKGMIWEHKRQNHELFNHYQKLIKIRNEHPALQIGDFRSAYVDSGRNLFGFVRSHKEERIFVLLNNSSKYRTVTVELSGFPEHVIDLYTDTSYRLKNRELTINLLPKSGVIIN